MDDVGLPLAHEADVADEPLVEDGVDGGASSLAYLVDQVQAVMRHPAVPFCKAAVRVEPFCETFLPCCL